MSRHRFVRNLDLNEELDDDALDDGAEELPEEEYAILMEGLEHIRDTIGPEAHSGIPDQEIKDTLYYYHYDVEQSLDWILQQQERRNAAKEAKDPNEKALPLPPPGGSDQHAYFAPPVIGAAPGPISASGRSNVPLIRLAQPPEVIEVEEVFEYDEESFHGGRFSPALSVIPERSERTESTADWTPRQEQARSLSSRAPSTLTTTDYGEVIQRVPKDPNTITPSPPLSALQRLSKQEPAPSVTPTESRRSSSSTQKAPSIRAQAAGYSATIPDSQSSMHARVGIAGTSQASLLSKQSVTGKGDDSANGEKKSKLASLTSSRRSGTNASVVSSVSQSSASSRSYSIDSSSVLTYPPLRPSSASVLSLQPPDDQSSTTDESSMSSHVRRAIKTALEMEAIDRAAAKAAAAPAPTSPAPAQQTRGISMSSPITPTPARSAAPVSAPPATSRLSQLAQRRAASATSSSSSLTARPIAAPAPAPAPVTSPALASSAPSVPALGQPREPASPPHSKRQPSKLAQLAQAKAQQAHRYPLAKPTVMEGASQGLITHRSHTEYITPIANGSTATTAITTTYQSLGGLLPMSRSGLPSTTLHPIHSVPTASLKATPGATPAEPKQSKLAMKSRKGQRKTEPEPEPAEERSPVEMAMFAPKPSRTRALPSAFASVLSDEHPLTPLEGNAAVDKREGKRSKAARDERGEAGPSREREKRRVARDKRASAAPVPLAPSGGFAFDVPSPDDIIFNARQGTALGSRSASASSHPSRVVAGVSA